MEEAHDKVVTMNGFDSDSSVGTTYMEKPIQYKVTAIAAYKKWKAKRNAKLGKKPSAILTDSANKKPARETHVPKEKDALFKGKCYGFNEIRHKQTDCPTNPPSQERQSGQGKKWKIRKSSA